MCGGLTFLRAECPQIKSSFGWFEVSHVNNQSREETLETVVLDPKEFRQVANDLCEKALSDAKEQLHPLLRHAELNHLDRRDEFVQSFKSALEQRIARTLAAWQPSVQAVFRFDESSTENWETWDGSIHLLVKVPSILDALKSLGRMLDRSLVKCFRQLDWSRFQECQSILDIQQVTESELRHCVGYGAMFCAVYTVPVRVWPQEKNRSS
jgi:hypothetical protein